MTEFDNETIERFLTLLRDVAKSETYKRIRGLKLEFYSDMRVDAVENINQTLTGKVTIDKNVYTVTVDKPITKTATVVDLVTGETLLGIPNCTGEALEKDQIVRVYTATDLFPGTNRQSYIGAIGQTKATN